MNYTECIENARPRLGKYCLLEESFLDHMVEEIYSKIYSDIVEE